MNLGKIVTKDTFEKEFSLALDELEKITEETFTFDRYVTIDQEKERLRNVKTQAKEYLQTLLNFEPRYHIGRIYVPRNINEAIKFAHKEDAYYNDTFIKEINKRELNHRIQEAKEFMEKTEQHIKKYRTKKDDDE